MNKYRTHLIVNLKDTRLIEKLSFANAIISTSPEPTSRFWESKDGKHTSFYMGGRGSIDISIDEVPQNELIITSETEEKAEDVLSLIHGGMLLAYPDLSMKPLSLFITSYAEENVHLYQEKPFIDYFKRLNDVGFGCNVASLAMSDTQFCYAIEKYKVSLELNSFTPHSADPRYGQIFEHYDVKHSYHTRAAFALISAYSVIEELGLEIRSSSKKPRFIDTKTGEWNPEVLLDINMRLINAGITSNMTFDWIYRGTPTHIENEIKPYFGADSEWVTYGKDIRDKTLTFPEAIHNASYLRNFIASHKFNELTQYISPYDIFNVQSLARKLILEKMGLWNAMVNRFNNIS